MLQIVAGLEPEHTNTFLQMLGQAARQGDGAIAVQQVLATTAPPAAAAAPAPAAAAAPADGAGSRRTSSSRRATKEEEGRRASREEGGRRTSKEEEARPGEARHSRMVAELAGTVIFTDAVTATA